MEMLSGIAIMGVHCRYITTMSELLFSIFGNIGIFQLEKVAQVFSTNMFVCIKLNVITPRKITSFSILIAKLLRAVTVGDI